MQLNLNTAQGEYTKTHRETRQWRELEMKDESEGVSRDRRGGRRGEWKWDRHEKEEDSHKKKKEKFLNKFQVCVKATYAEEKPSLSWIKVQYSW